MRATSTWLLRRWAIVAATLGVLSLSACVSVEYYPDGYYHHSYPRARD